MSICQRKGPFETDNSKTFTSQYYSFIPPHRLALISSSKSSTFYQAEDLTSDSTLWRIAFMRTQSSFSFFINY